MIEVFIDGACYPVDDLDEIRQVLRKYTGQCGRVRCTFDARNPQDEWVTYEGCPEIVLKQLNDEWSEHEAQKRAYWGY